MFRTLVLVVPKLSVAVNVTGVATKKAVGVPVNVPFDDDKFTPYAARLIDDEYVMVEAGGVSEVDVARNPIGAV
jgi:hypothetical protein